MWGILFKTILIFLAIIGLTEVFRLLAFHFLRTRHRGKLFGCSPSKGTTAKRSSH